MKTYAVAYLYNELHIKFVEAEESLYAALEVLGQHDMQYDEGDFGSFEELKEQLFVDADVYIEVKEIKLTTRIAPGQGGLFAAGKQRVLLSEEDLDEGLDD